MKKLLFLFGWLLSGTISAQELYVFSEPASNMPAYANGIKQTLKWLPYRPVKGSDVRSTTEWMYGVNKNWMVHGAITFSDMYSNNFRWESWRLYTKYRFYSSDDLYRHFRMAAYAEVSTSSNSLIYDELSMDGDQSGWQAGIIATQLLHKLAISGSAGITKTFLDPDTLHHKSVPPISREAFMYSVSAGYLIFPRTYTSYDQTNLNLYCEWLGQEGLTSRRGFLDMAPALQLIFKSQFKLNLGYRFQLAGDMRRMAQQSWLLSTEWLFLRKSKAQRSK
ncbi:MAG: hypothetical protein ACK54Y_04180 [Bacteroidota bacterium]